MGRNPFRAQYSKKMGAIAIPLVQSDYTLESKLAFSLRNLTSDTIIGIRGEESDDPQRHPNTRGQARLIRAGFK